MSIENCFRNFEVISSSDSPNLSSLTSFGFCFFPVLAPSDALAIWSSSNSPIRTMIFFCRPFRQSSTGTSIPIGVSATILGNRLIASTFLPLKVRMTSPGFMPAFFAGPFCETSATKAPDVSFRPKLSAISSVTI